MRTFARSQPGLDTKQTKDARRSMRMCLCGGNLTASTSTPSGEKMDQMMTKDYIENMRKDTDDSRRPLRLALRGRSGTSMFPIIYR